MGVGGILLFILVCSINREQRKTEGVTDVIIDCHFRNDIHMCHVLLSYNSYATTRLLVCFDNSESFFLRLVIIVMIDWGGEAGATSTGCAALITNAWTHLLSRRRVETSLFYTLSNKRLRGKSRGRDWLLVHGTLIHRNKSAVVGELSAYGKTD